VARPRGRQAGGLPRALTRGRALAALDLRPIVDALRRVLDRHRLGPGLYARFTLPADGREPNPYGCADAANLSYTLGELPGAWDERRARVDALRRFQDPASGLFHEPTHDPIHVTAHCLGALELFDARAIHPLVALAPLREPGAVAPFLESLDWRGEPWTASHRGAGLYAALWLSGAADAAWRSAYFGWLAEACDPATGLWRRGALPAGPDLARWCFPHLAGTFHYLFCFEHARLPHPHPAALVDTCLAAREAGAWPFARFVGFAELDWIYCLSRALRQSGHRFDQARTSLRALAADTVAFLAGLDADTDPGLDDLHAAFGAACALAELQQALPGELRSDRPLRLVLDRRPFV
jgi:hypothetical protein